MSIEPVRDKVTLRQGHTFDETWQFFLEQTEAEVAGQVPPVPENFTGCTAKAQWKKDLDTAAIASLTLLNGTVANPPAQDVIELGGSAGTLRLYIRDETLAAIAHTVWTDAGGGKYTGLCQVEIEKANGERSRYLELKVTFSREVTV